MIHVWTFLFTKWCIMEYGTRTLWDLWIWPIPVNCRQKFHINQDRYAHTHEKHSSRLNPGAVTMRNFQAIYCCFQNQLWFHVTYFCYILFIIIIPRTTLSWHISLVIIYHDLFLIYSLNVGGAIIKYYRNILSTSFFFAFCFQRHGT